MLDGIMRRVVEPPLHYMAKWVTFSANTITLTALVIGLSAIPWIAMGHYHIGWILILLNRLMDGLDGAIARQKGPTDLGGFLDIVCDFIFYAGVVFAFALAQPQFAIWAAFLLFSFMGTSSSFLAFATIAAKQRLFNESRGLKTIYYLGGLMEGTETILFFSLFCLFSHWFGYLAIIFGILCWITTLSRIAIAWKQFH